jgi:hypothetical protein
VSTVRLDASIDPKTQETYVPARKLAADGSLRRCRGIDISSRGVLRAFTNVLGVHYGLLDLDHEVRIQARLDDGPHEVGAAYEARPLGESDLPSLPVGQVVFGRA